MVKRSINMTPKAIAVYLKSLSEINEKVAATTLKKGVSIITKIPRLMIAVGSPLKRFEKMSEKYGRTKEVR